MTLVDEMELLYLASKAYGVEIFWLSRGPKRAPVALYRVRNKHYSFNSLHNDGDCARLADKIRASIVHHKKLVEVFVRVSSSKCHFIEECFDEESERHPATRLAVTRIAAKIGKGLK